MESYETLGVIGEGTYGVVIKARHRASGQLVAIKKFKQAEDDDHVRKTSLREVRVLKQLHHPNVIALLDVFRRDGKLYLVFEYIENTILQLLEGTEAGLPSADVRRYMYQLLRGVDYCHAHSVIHRDVKPENVLVSEDGILKVCDFGFARHLTSKGKYTDYVATRWYRAPELLVGDVSYGKAVDIWAIGCIFAEISDTQPLFPGDSDLDQLSLILRACGPIPQRLVQTFERNPLYRRVSFPHTRVKQSLEQRFRFESPDWLEFFLACLQTDPDKRPSCAELMNLPYFTRDNFRYDYEQELRRLNAPSLTPRASESVTSVSNKPASNNNSSSNNNSGSAGAVTRASRSSSHSSPQASLPCVTMSELPSLTLTGGAGGAHLHHPPHQSHASPPDAAPTASLLPTTMTAPRQNAQKPLRSPLVAVPCSPASHGQGPTDIPLESQLPTLPEIGARRPSLQSQSSPSPQDAAMTGAHISREIIAPSGAATQATTAHMAASLSQGFDLDSHASSSRNVGGGGGGAALASPAGSGGFPQLSVLWAQYLGENSPGTTAGGSQPPLSQQQPATLQNYAPTTTTNKTGSIDHGGAFTGTSTVGHPFTHSLGSQPSLGKRSSGLFNPALNSSTRTSTTNAELIGPVAMAMTGIAPSSSFHNTGPMSNGRYGAELEGFNTLGHTSHLPPLAGGPHITTLTLNTAALPSASSSACSVLSPNSTQAGLGSVPTPLGARNTSFLKLSQQAMQPQRRGSLLSSPLSPIQPGATTATSPVLLSCSTSTTVSSGAANGASRTYPPPPPLMHELTGVPETSASLLHTPDADVTTGHKGKKKGNAHEPAIAPGASPTAPRRSPVTSTVPPIEKPCSPDVPPLAKTLPVIPASSRPNAESQPAPMPLTLATVPDMSTASAPSSTVTATRVRLNSTFLSASPTEVTAPLVAPAALVNTAMELPPPVGASLVTVPEKMISAGRTTLSGPTTATMSETAACVKEGEDTSDGETDQTLTGGDTSALPSSFSPKHDSRSEPLNPASIATSSAAQAKTTSPTAAAAGSPVLSPVVTPTSARAPATPPVPRPPSTRPESASSAALRGTPRLRSLSHGQSGTVEVPSSVTTPEALPVPRPSSHRGSAVVAAAQRSTHVPSEGSGITLAFRETTAPTRSNEAILAVPATQRAGAGAASPPKGSGTQHSSASHDLTVSPSPASLMAGDAVATAQASHEKSSEKPSLTKRRQRRAYAAEHAATGTDADGEIISDLDGDALTTAAAASEAGATHPPPPPAPSVRGTGVTGRHTNHRLSTRVKGTIKGASSSRDPSTDTGGTVVRKKRKAAPRRSTHTSLGTPTSSGSPSPSPALATTPSRKSAPRKGTSPSPARVRNDTGLNLSPVPDEDRGLPRQRFAQYYRANSNRHSSTLEKLTTSSGRTTTTSHADQTTSGRGSGQPEGDSPHQPTTLAAPTALNKDDDVKSSSLTRLHDGRGVARRSPHNPNGTYGANLAQSRGRGTRGPLGSNAARGLGGGVRAPTLHELVMAPYDTKRKSRGTASRSSDMAGKNMTAAEVVETHKDRQDRLDTLGLYARPAYLHNTMSQGGAGPAPNTPLPAEDGSGGGTQLGRLRRGPGGNHAANQTANTNPHANQRMKTYGASVRTQPISGRTGEMKL